MQLGPHEPGHGRSVSLDIIASRIPWAFSKNWARFRPPAADDVRDRQIGVSIAHAPPLRFVTNKVAS